MSATPLDLFFVWAAIPSAVASLGTLVTSILFFAVNPAFGKVNDTVSVVQMVVMLPVAAAMALLIFLVSGALAWLALAVGSNTPSSMRVACSL